MAELNAAIAQFGLDWGCVPKLIMLNPKDYANLLSVVRKLERLPDCAPVEDVRIGGVSVVCNPHMGDLGPRAWFWHDTPAMSVLLPPN